MNTSAEMVTHEGTKRDDGARRGSIPDHYHSYSQQQQGSQTHQGGSLTTPAPSPHGRPSSVSSADYPPQPSSSITPDHYQHQRYSNGHSTGAHSPDQNYKDQYPSSQQPPSQLTPSPPLPSPADGFQGRPLPPIEPSHPLHSYMSNSRRGSVTDPDFYASATDAHKRSSISAVDSTSFYNSNGSSNTNGPGQGSRHYANSSPSSVASSNSEPHYPPYPHPSTSPMQLRQSEHISGRRESLPSIHSSAGPLGQLLAQEPQRRHSIAHGDQMMGPLKRKTSSTPLSQMHSSSELEHPAKRRDSIPDAAIPLHHSHHHHPYPPRSSFSAPSSPPRRGSNATLHGPVPTLNLQPAAEIKLSMMPASLHSGNGAPPSVMDHVRPHFPLHQPRRPSLLSEASLSRRSSVAENHHYTSHYQPSSSSSHQQDYDHNMDMDMERMHLHGPDQAPPHPNSTPGGGQGTGGHLYPGYPAAYPNANENGHKGDTPYSRSPELRISHKLAERKRRKEMKELFDELRDALPVDRSLKTSKWEILSKAVDYISGMRENQEAMSKEIDMLRQEVARLKNL
ncbi:hypothetical protein FBU30_001980 [Linnemannia zychae]|nr:hypothetical protein FBU30_001980 [Linnemannia zychae]